MTSRDISHLRLLYQSLPNLGFIGVTLFFSLVVHPAFLFILLAGELGLLMLAQTAPVQRILRARAEKERNRDQERTENQILDGLPEHYRGDFLALKKLCGEIGNRTRELGSDRPLLDGIVEKLYSFRMEYIRMLRGHFLLSNRNYAEVEERLEEETERIEKALGTEQSAQVRMTMDQHLQILRQRITKTRQLADLVRLIEARLQVVGDSLQLIQDEVYSMTDVQGLSGVVDDLLVKIQMNEEVRSYYNDVLNDESPLLAGLGSTEPNGKTEFSRPPDRTNIERVP